MNRPQIYDFFPESTTPKDLNQLFLANPELYRYIQALDGYIDELEQKFDDVRPMSDGIEMLKKEIEIIPEDLGIIRFKTNHGDILVKQSKFLKQDEMVVIDLTKKPDQ